ncbi:MAG: hypothetical protein AAFR59_09455 [Bacteroidota bacterium]
MTGGLNTHIAHHLSPQVWRVHYYELTPIIRQATEEFGMAYHEKSFWDALKSHFRYMRKMGR